MRPPSFISLRTASFNLLLTIILFWALHARAGGEDSSLPLIPGDVQRARHPTLATESDDKVEIRRAVPVLDPLDPTRLSTGSLWKEGITNEDGMFADRRARRRGDILTLIISENTTITNTLDQQTSKANNVNSVLDQFVLKLPKKLPLVTQTGDVTPNGVLGLTNSYKGSAQLNQQQSLTSRAALTVVDLLPNGNLVVEGNRIITFGGETKYVELRGIVRRDDVAPDDTVISTNLADATVRFLSAGSLTDAQKKGWLSRAVDRFNPL